MTAHCKRGPVNLPDKYAALFGGVKVNRGTLSGDYGDPSAIKLAQWDAAPPCRQEFCPSFAICDYRDKRGRCRVHVFYMRNRASMYFDNLAVRDDEQEVWLSYISEPQWHDIGMKIMPVWGNLCRMKIELAGAVSFTYTDARGNLRVHPLLKVHNDSIFLITKLEKDCGLREFLNRGATLVPSEPSFTKGGDDDTDYYSMVESESGIPVRDPNENRDRRRIVKRKSQKR